MVITNIVEQDEGGVVAKEGNGVTDIVEAIDARSFNDNNLEVSDPANYVDNLDPEILITLNHRRGIQRGCRLRRLSYCRPTNLKSFNNAKIF